MKMVEAEIWEDTMTFETVLVPENETVYAYKFADTKVRTHLSQASWSAYHRFYIVRAFAVWSEHYRSYLFKSEAAWVENKNDYYLDSDVICFEGNCFLKTEVAIEDGHILTRSELRRLIPPYHNSEDFIADLSGSDFKFGFELELEFDRDNLTGFYECYKKVRELYWLHIERDGSLNFGFEIVSDIIDWEFLKSHYAEFKELLEYISQRAIQKNGAGLHIHFSFPEWTNYSGDILNGFLEFYKTAKGQQKVKEFFGRLPTDYSFIPTYKNTFYTSHHTAISFNNPSKGVEVRLFKSVPSIKFIIRAITFAYLLYLYAVKKINIFPKFILQEA